MMNIHTEPTRLVGHRLHFLFNGGMVRVQGSTTAEMIERQLLISRAADLEGEATELAAMLDVSLQALCDFKACRLDGGWSEVSVQGGL
ncbi:helix-turn-helix domain-containing protein [Xylella taiwanensis]|uniref:Uncharacterized protein n=2 Tax=Xylella taiwanensis TaxID=1444770 RepID=Z9JJC5_9GAMM|nr:hypothetical protein [Xylella taiwanensis]EWS78294.1 hypothetical protein AF72_06160 [Xylella taiwanensis]MCD8458052.1 hypothetical protein [Xylella taiwanensis]MCD8469914.1 hypothetical protein [Xylella taiwanensis]NBI36472.1 helix-turn-helix domain-containing protein [Xylella taiwanensis]UFN11512.1 hypothetical protein LPH44_00995 [Xylella taiwanensis]